MVLSDLHDATLQTIKVDWETALLEVRIKTGTNDSDTQVLEAEGLTDFKCPRLLPWGPSHSINSASLQIRLSEQLLVIEMQSGDRLEVSCKSVSRRPRA